MTTGPADIPTPAIGQWPPVASRGVPPDVVMTLEPGGDRVRIRNTSDTGYWIVPGFAPIWYGGAPWVTSDEWTATSRELQGGATIVLEVGLVRGTGPARVGVLLWSEPEPDTSADSPWFLWADLP